MITKPRLIQLILILVGIVLSVFLYNQPKFVVEHDQALTTKPEEQEVPTSSDNTHSLSLTEDQILLANSLSKKISEYAGNVDKISIFADSLGDLYYNNYLYDSASKYYGLVFQNLKSPEKGLKLADSYFKQFEFAENDTQRKEQAIQTRGLYETLVKENGKNELAETRIAMLKVITEPMPMAGISELNALIQNNPENISARMYLAEFQMTVHKFEKAKEHLEYVLKKEPTNFKALVYAADCYLQLGEKNKVENILNSLEKLNTKKDPYILQFVQQKREEINK